ncbi:MAG: hypothetical protein ACTS41_00970 [Candidatus Hodgkinia cicadicola]
MWLHLFGGSSAVLYVKLILFGVWTSFPPFIEVAKATISIY